MIFRPTFYFSINANQSLLYEFEGRITNAWRTRRNTLVVSNVEGNYEVRIIEWAKMCEYHDKIEKGRNRHAQSFPPKLRRKIHSLEILEKSKNELILEIDENSDESEVTNETAGIRKHLFHSFL